MISYEEFGLLIKHVSETTKNEATEQKGGFLDMLLGTLSAVLLDNLLAGLEKVPLEQVKDNITERAKNKAGRIFNTTSSFNKF